MSKKGDEEEFLFVAEKVSNRKFKLHAHLNTVEKLSFTHESEVIIIKDEVIVAALKREEEAG